MIVISHAGYGGCIFQRLTYVAQGMRWAWRPDHTTASGTRQRLEMSLLPASPIRDAAMAESVPAIQKYGPGKRHQTYSAFQLVLHLLNHRLMSSFTPLSFVPLHLQRETLPLKLRDAAQQFALAGGGFRWALASPAASASRIPTWGGYSPRCYTCHFRRCRQRCPNVGSRRGTLAFACLRGICNDLHGAPGDALVHGVQAAASYAKLASVRL